MDEPLPSELLARYLASEADATERATVDGWAAADPANAAELSRLREAWLAKRGPAWDVDRAWSRVETRLDDSAPVGSIESHQRWDRTPIVRVAAAVVLVAGLAFAWRELRPSGSPESNVFATSVGERRSIDLADGTHVVLGPLSELRVDKAYNRSGRRVDLYGEAWFEVRHDSLQAFRVHAGGTVTEDLGTSFSVRALGSVVRVVVVEGSVAVGLESATPGPRATLKARDVAEVDVRTSQVQFPRNTNVEALVAWRSGRVEFGDTPLAEVAIELKRWYGLTMRFGGPDVARKTVTYSMPTNDLAEALDVLGRTTGVTIDRKGDTLFVR